jgi:hypothetical protein
MLYPMANMAVRANSVKHLECRFAAKLQQLEALFIGSKIMPRAFFSRRSTDFGAGKHNHITRHAHQQSMDPIQKNARYPENGIESRLLTQPAAAAPSRILPHHPQA